MTTIIGYIEVDPDSRVPKYRQIINAILKGIKSGSLMIGERVPSINEMSEKLLLSRDTVEKAYNELKEQKILESVKGKGFYIAKTDLVAKVNVLFLINKLSNYKMKIFNAFVQTLSPRVHVDLDIYHCEPMVFTKRLSTKIGQYDHYVVMSHFKTEESQHIDSTPETLSILKSIPPEKLIILDADISEISNDAGRVCQDFTNDIYHALKTRSDTLKRYRKIMLVYPSNAVYPYPTGIVTGFEKFCREQSFDFEILDKVYDGMEFQVNDLFITIEETDLVNLVKQIRDTDYKLGQEIGVISYNDTPLKELLGITVISTNFTKMGEEAAKMILEERHSVLKNEFNFIDRQST